jgi:hypothetical protein
MSVEFVDTNILVYAHDRSAGEKQRIAADLVLRLTRSRCGAASLQVLSELFVTITRKIPNPVRVSEAIELVEDAHGILVLPMQGNGKTYRVPGRIVWINRAGQHEKPVGFGYEFDRKQRRMMRSITLKFGQGMLIR